MHREIHGSRRDNTTGFLNENVKAHVKCAGTFLIGCKKVRHIVFIQSNEFLNSHSICTNTQAPTDLRALSSSISKLNCTLARNQLNARSTSFVLIGGQLVVHRAQETSVMSDTSLSIRTPLTLLLTQGGVPQNLSSTNPRQALAGPRNVVLHRTAFFSQIYATLVPLQLLCSPAP